MVYLAATYLTIGVAAGALAAGYLLWGYRSRVWLPAREIHGAGRVAVAEDLGMIVALSLAAIVGWLPLLVAYAYVRTRRVFTRDRVRENNPTPTL